MNFVFISSFITLIGFIVCVCFNKITTENIAITTTKVAVAGGYGGGSVAAYV